MIPIGISPPDCAKARVPSRDKAALDSKTSRRFIDMAPGFDGAAMRRPLMTSLNGKFSIAAIGDQHGPRRVGDGEIGSRLQNDRLGGDSARPKYRHFVRLNAHRVTIVGLR